MKRMIQILFIAAIMPTVVYAKPSQTELITAIASKNNKLAKELIEQGVSVNPECEQKEYCSPLLMAIENSDTDLVKLIIKQGADVNIDSGLGMYAIDIVLSKYFGAADNKEREEKYLPMINKMVKAGLDINKFNGFGHNPLTQAAAKGDVKLVKKFLKNGANPNLKSEGSLAFGATAIMFAAEKGHKKVVSILLKHKADKSLKDTLGRTAADYATQSGYDDVASMLKM